MAAWWPKRAVRGGGRAALDRGRLAAVGIDPAALAGRLRLVLPVGCAHDFTQTRAILQSGPAGDQVEAALALLQTRGASCDCSVFQALGEVPRCVLWHPNVLDDVSAVEDRTGR